MIPYDDLVVALQSWRARQGLPVAQLANLAPAAPSASDSGSIAATARPAPPMAPPKAAVPPPLAPAETHDDVDDAAGLLVEEAHYENEGDDFAMAFGAPAEPDFESTAIGTAPPASPAGQRDSFGGSTEPEPPAGKHNQNDDW